MGKDETIIKLIERLRLIIRSGLLEVVDFWESDLCAIGLKKGNRLIYISTFNYIAANEIKYDCDLELINGINIEQIKVIKQIRGVTEAELRDEIITFLKL